MIKVALNSAWLFLAVLNKRENCLISKNRMA